MTLLFQRSACWQRRPLPPLRHRLPCLVVPGVLRSLLLAHIQRCSSPTSTLFVSSAIHSSQRGLPGHSLLTNVLFFSRAQQPPSAVLFGFQVFGLGFITSMIFIFFTGARGFCYCRTAVTADYSAKIDTPTALCVLRTQGCLCHRGSGLGFSGLANGRLTRQVPCPEPRFFTPLTAHPHIARRQCQRLSDAMPFVNAYSLSTLPPSSALTVTASHLNPHHPTHPAPALREHNHQSHPISPHSHSLRSQSLATSTAPRSRSAAQ